VWLQSTPFALFELFPKKILAQAKEQLRDLRKILKMKPNYQMIKVKNGEFF